MLEKIAPALIGLAGTLIGALLVVLGWGISHWLTIEREIEAKRREQRLTYLISTFRVLTKIKAYDKLCQLDKIDDAVQTAAADLQLFGSPGQIVMFKEFVDSFINNNTNVEPLLTSLRDELRKELRREKTEEKLIWLTLLDPENYSVGPSLKKSPVVFKRLRFKSPW
jgi:hypothetical protein